MDRHKAETVAHYERQLADTLERIEHKKSLALAFEAVGRLDKAEAHRADAEDMEIEVRYARGNLARARHGG